MVNQIDLTDAKVSNIEVVNMLKVNTGVMPSHGVTGMIFFNTSNNKLHVHTGTTFEAVH
mgnify:CR=1 FL=1